MAKEKQDFKVGSKTLSEILGVNFPYDDLGGVVVEGDLVEHAGNPRVFGKVLVDFKGGHRQGSWMRSSRVLERKALKPIDGVPYELVTTKNSSYVVSFRGGM